MLVLFLAASAAPTPLYRVYQARWGFSATTLAAVFAVYVLFLLMTVLIFGSLSDYVGRRPVIITALAVDTAACILFLLAHGVGALFAARALPGVAVGLAASALGAALLDLRPDGSLAPLVTGNGGTVGLALGALGTSVLVQYGPVPTHLVCWLLLGTFLATILLAAATPEPGTVRPGALASLRPDVSVPRSARGTFTRAAPCLVAVWALGGFYLLGPSLAAQLSGSHNLLWGGVITFLLTGLGAVTSSVFRNSAPPAVMLGGCLGLLAGAVVTVAAIVASTPALLLLGTVIADPSLTRRLPACHRMQADRQPGRQPHQLPVTRAAARKHRPAVISTPDLVSLPGPPADVLCAFAAWWTRYLKSVSAADLVQIPCRCCF